MKFPTWKESNDLRMAKEIARGRWDLHVPSRMDIDISTTKRVGVPHVDKWLHTVFILNRIDYKVLSRNTWMHDSNIT